MSVNREYSIPESSEIITGNTDVAEKFRLYRMDVESTERKFKGANEVIERLKEEINFSRDSENNLRSQLSSAQNRLIHSQRALKKIIAVSEQQRQTEKVSRQIEQKAEKMEEEIKRIREESENLLERATREIDLLKETENLKSILAQKNRENDLMKMEIQALTKEKNNVVAASQQQLRILESELEKLRQRQVDAEANYGDILKYYQQQLEEKDQTIKTYEKERKSFLDEFEPLKVSPIGTNSVRYGDDSISTQQSKRAPKSDIFEDHNCQAKLEESNANVSRHSQSEKKWNARSSRKAEDQNHPKGSRKQKPKLEFLIQPESPSQNTIGVKNDRKRRLFSASSNYYTD